MLRLDRYVLAHIFAALAIVTMLCFPMSAQAQNRTVRVTGQVLDEADQPLAGVAVTISGGTRGVTTDLDGSFTISVNIGQQLDFSYLGYSDYSVKINDDKRVVVKMQPQANEMDEVTIVAFSKQKKESVIGSIATVKPAELKVPSSNLTTALAGRVAGMISYQRSGEPGMDNADFFIRGVTTFGYKVDPLILIDNVEMTSTDLARLQVDDIASFSIMKDATATALYGARGANGVILVTTKQGSEGPAKLSFRYETSISTPTQDVDLADPITYMRLANEAVLTRDPLGMTLYSEGKIDNTIAGTNPYAYPATDWKDALLSNLSTSHRANLSIRGGGKVAQYYVAAGFTQENGILKVDKQNNFNNNIDLKNYSLRSNVNINITKTTELIVRMTGQFADYNGPIDGGTALYNKIMKTNPVLFPAYYPKTEDYQYVNHILFGNYDEGQYINPYADMVRGYKEYSRTMLSSQFELKQKFDFITEGLSARVLFNAKRNSYYEVSRAYNPFYYTADTYDKNTGKYTLRAINPDGGTEYLNYSPGAKTVSADMYLEASLNYDRTFAEKHAVSGLLVFQAKHNVTGNAATLQESLPYRNLGLSGRATYGYDSRYFIELNFGYNGSERFSANHRWGFFPSAGFGWMVSNEPFWGENLKNVISKLKIKGTYGLVGNDAIGSSRFLYLSEVNMNNSDRGAAFGTDGSYSKDGITLNRYENKAITWEVAKKGNVGFELSLFDAIELQAEYYKERRDNILMTRANTSSTMGLSAQPVANIGKAEGEGIDMSLDVNKAFGKNWWIQARMNFTYATSKYLVYEEPNYADAPWKSRVGYSLGQQWGYLAERLFVDDAEVKNSPYQNFGEYAGGDIKYHDVNGDGQITALDQVPIGWPTTPEIVYGFGVSVGWKNLDFSCFFQGMARESFWIDPAATAPFYQEHQLLQAYADSHWSEDNRDLYALWPRLGTTLSSNNNQRSTWFMRDGSFLRLKSLEIGYTFRVKKWKDTGFRLYLSGTNLLTFSNFKLWDPEMAGNGLGYPVQRVFNIGLNVNL